MGILLPLMIMLWVLQTFCSFHEAVGETRQQTRAGHGVSERPYTCALRSVQSGQWGGSGFGGKADPVTPRTPRRSVSTCGATTQTCAHGSVLVVAAAGGGAGLSGASTTTEQCRSAQRTGTRCMRPGGSGHKHTARPSHGGGGSGCLARRMPSVLNATPPRPQRRGVGGGRNYTHKHVLWKWVCSPASRRGLAHGPRCSGTWTGPWTPTALPHIP